MEKEIAKLHKIAGQVIGLSKMIENSKDCEKTIIQFQAVKGALNSVFYDFLNNNLNQCIRKRKSKELKGIIKEISKK
jgi:DNA-binding FrmR family transcriptional regulator